MIKYNVIDVGKDNIKLSPSGLSKFISDPKSWLADLEGRSSFTGNAATVYGTCVHYIFESVFAGRTDAKYFEDVDIYLVKETLKSSISEAEEKEIEDRIKKNFQTFKNWAIFEDTGHVITSESSVVAKLPTKFAVKGTEAKYFIAGSLDAIVAYKKDGNQFEYKNDNDEYISKSTAIQNTFDGKSSTTILGDEDDYVIGIRDYKTANRATKSLKQYLLQLTVYALAYNKSVGKDEKHVTFVEVIHISETKTNGIKINVLREEITPYVKEKTIKLLQTVVKTHSLSTKTPALKPLLFREGTAYGGGLQIFD